MTHIVPCDARAVRTGQFRARCGQLIDGAQHSASPECAECRRLDAEDESSLLSLSQSTQESFGGPPVKHQVFDPTRDTPRRDERQRWGGTVGGRRGR